MQILIGIFLSTTNPYESLNGVSCHLSLFRKIDILTRWRDSRAAAEAKQERIVTNQQTLCRFLDKHIWEYVQYRAIVCECPPIPMPHHWSATETNIHRPNWSQVSLSFFHFPRREKDRARKWRRQSRLIIHSPLRELVVHNWNTLINDWKRTEIFRRKTKDNHREQPMMNGNEKKCPSSCSYNSSSTHD